jgi:hypothetical protein
MERSDNPRVQHGARGLEKAIPGGTERAVPQAPSRKTRQELIREVQEESGGAKVKLHVPKEY